MKQHFTLKTILIAAMCLLGVGQSWAETDPITKTFDFEDGQVLFNQESRITTAIEDNAELNSKVVGFTCAGNAQNGYSNSFYNLSGAFGEDINKADKVSIKMKYYNTNGGRAYLSIRDASIAQAYGKTAYSKTGAWFRIGSDKNNSYINDNKYGLTALCNIWLVVEVNIDVTNKTVEYKVSKNSDGTVLYSTTSPIAPYSSDVINCSQIDIFGYINNSHCAMIDDIEVTVTPKNVEYADYTIKYVDAADNELKDAASRNGEVGTNPILLAADKNAINANGKKYIYDTDEANSVEIASDGTSVVKVIFREAAVYNYTATNNVNADVKKGSGFEGDNVAVPFAQYILKDGTLWRKGANSNEYRQTVNLDTDNKVVNLAYSATDINNVVYFSEAEDIEGMTVSDGQFISIRCSGAKGGHCEEKVVVTTLPAGKYTVSGQCRNNTPKFYLGDAEEEFFSFTSTGSIVSSTSDEISIMVPTELKVLAEGDDKGNALDWVYIQKTGDPDDVAVALNAAGFGTFSAAYPVKITGAKVYTLAYDGDVTLTATEVEDGVVPAGEGVLLCNAAGDVTAAYTATAATADFTTNSLKATTTATQAVVAKEGALVLKSNKFVQYTGEAFAANKAYIPYEKVSAAKPLSIVFADDATGVEQAEAQEAQEAEGKYIEGGKLVIKKGGKKYNAAGAEIF